MRFIKIVTAAFLVAATPACAQPAPAPAAFKDVDPALWVVKDADTTIYLFGTIHALKPGLSWFDEAVKTAFDSSDSLVLEIPMPSPEEAQKVMLPLAIDATGPTLTDKIPADKRAAYAAGLAKLGVPATAFDRYQPWFAAAQLGQLSLAKAGFGREEGVEKQLDAAAQAAHKPVSGLETLGQQLGYFHDLPQDAQIAFLLSGVEDIDKFDGEINKMVDLWSAGNPDGLGKLMNEDLTKQPVLKKALLTDRNARWAEWIEKRMDQPGTIFIAVGAGHLAGSESVQALLAKHGLKVTRIKY
ncbi:TraB/GumN family protein [Sphingomonas immobilis]|uniref:TraB/GumN family protein n=1 Tax=Sphingomonas immobilis TaxID=3063997 RepID=A0ABT8ZY97_9SPHN|nr:TraB/GumN family protein [Sphingomonas sp. CA1-15]MDO7842549.1 TraB/GumN family protein [Sphingomonas sp. CA1-15]